MMSLQDTKANYTPTDARCVCQRERQADKETQRAYKVLKYVVPRPEYRRLEYSALIAHEIYKELKNTDLHVPGIIKSDQISFLALVPTIRVCDELQNDEQITDITEEWWKTVETKKTRWIIFYPGDGVPVQIPKHDDVLHLAEKQVENLKKDSDVKRFLTFSFENEIFAYAEKAFKYVQSRMADKTEQQQKKLGMIDLKIRSLLVRKLPEHDTSAFLTSDEQPMENKKFRIPSSQHIKERLAKRSLQDCGIRGFCSTAKGILVFAAQPEEHTDRIDIVNRIRECFGEEKTEVVLVESIMTSHLVANGDILTNKTSSSRGTLGCFGKVGDSLVAITAGHCVQAGDMMQITDEDNRLIEFGNCTESYDQQDVDIAIIKIKADMVIQCDSNFCNENGDVCEASVYQKDCIKSWQVHKIGAATGPTTGIVYGGGAYVCEEEGLIINSNSDNDFFAKPGDSGAIVFFYDPTDVDNRRVKLLSIVSKQIGIRVSGTIPIGLSRKPTLTRRLDRGLNKVGDKIKLG